MLWEKVFVIGFNKTATSNFHKLFCHFGLRSQHHYANWDLDNFDCFSDNGDLQDTEFLKKNFPNALFILNTRRLDRWLLSRAIHCCPDEFGNFKSWGWPPTTELFARWILDRNFHFNKILSMFSDCPERLAVVDIEEPHWQKSVAKILGFEFSGNFFENTKKIVEIQHLDEINFYLDKTFDMYGISLEDRKCKLKKHNLIGIYKNNLLTKLHY